MSVNYVQPSTPKTGSLTSTLPRAEHLSQCYTALIETSQALNRNLEFHELLQFILERMLKVSGADLGSVLLADETGTLQFIGGRDMNGNVLSETALPLSPSIATRLLNSADVVCVRDVARDPGLRNDIDVAMRYLAGIVALPMFRGDAIMGAICLGSRVALTWINDTDLATLKSMAAQLSLATDSAIAYSEIARLNETVEYEVKHRTEQLTEANNWLVQSLRQAENDLAVQVEGEKLRNRFFSALAHELRSPTQLIFGHAVIMLDEGIEHLSQQQHESLKVILKTCEHLRNLVTKVMDAGKLNEGGMTLDPASLDIRPLINEVLESSRGLLTGKEVTLAYNYPPDLPNVLADAMRVRQVLLNLLANACRFTDKGMIRVSAAERDGFVVINVADTGIGIPEDKLPTLFEAYTQADSLRSHTGTGLGLMICKQLVELHGGKLWVNSKPGVGSVFSFSLPIVLS